MIMSWYGTFFDTVGAQMRTPRGYNKYYGNSNLTNIWEKIGCNFLVSPNKVSKLL